MTRLAYLWRLLDRRDATVLAFVLGIIVLGSYGVGHVTAAHVARVERQRECVARIERTAARRGWRVERIAAVAPCDMNGGFGR